MSLGIIKKDSKEHYSEIVNRMFDYAIRMMDPSIPFLRRKAIAWVLNEMLIELGEGGVRKDVISISMEDVENIARRVVKFLTSRIKVGVYG